MKSASSTAYYQATIKQKRESSYKCETFEDLIFASEPFDVVNGERVGIYLLGWGRSLESLSHFSWLSGDQHTQGPRVDTAVLIQIVGKSSWLPMHALLSSHTSMKTVFT